MKSTSAALVIIQALWPGPEMCSAVFGSALVRYDSSAVRRCSMEGEADAGVSCAVAFEKASARNAIVNVVIPMSRMTDSILLRQTNREISAAKLLRRSKNIFARE